MHAWPLYSEAERLNHHHRGSIPDPPSTQACARWYSNPFSAAPPGTQHSCKTRWCCPKQLVASMPPLQPATHLQRRPGYRHLPLAMNPG